CWSAEMVAASDHSYCRSDASARSHSCAAFSTGQPAAIATGWGECESAPAGFFGSFSTPLEWMSARLLHMPLTRLPLSTCSSCIFAGIFVEKHGAAVIERVRQEQPAVYVKVVAGLLPRDLNLNVNNLDHLADAQLLARLRSLTEQAAPLLATLDGDGHDPTPAINDLCESVRF